LEKLILNWSRPEILIRETYSNSSTQEIATVTVVGGKMYIVNKKLINFSP